MPSKNGWTVAGVASSWRPDNSSVGTPMACTSSTTLQVRSVPMQRNSLGPFIVRYTVGSASSATKLARTSAGFGTTRQTWRS